MQKHLNKLKMMEVIGELLTCTIVNKLVGDLINSKLCDYTVDYVTINRLKGMCNARRLSNTAIRLNDSQSQQMVTGLACKGLNDIIYSFLTL